MTVPAGNEKGRNFQCREQSNDDDRDSNIPLGKVVSGVVHDYTVVQQR
jgi:hypothetical protein